MSRGKYTKSGYWKQSDGAEVVGLKRRPDGRFYAARDPGKTFGKDPTKAVFRFRQWQHDQAPLPNGVTHIEDTTDVIEPTTGEVIGQTRRSEDWADLNLADQGELTAFMDEEKKQRLSAVFAEWLANDPHDLARRTGISDLRALKPLRPSISLAAIGNLYHTTGRPTDEKWAKESEKYWDNFCEVVGGKTRTARDLVAEDITRYRDSIRELFTSGKVSRTYVKHRFGQIKTIFAFARKEGKDQEEIRRVLDLCAVLRPPKKREAKLYGKIPKKPEPISPKDMQALLNVCDEKWRAVFLLALNCALLPSEVAAVRKDEIKLEAGTFVSERSKTGQVRIGVLWVRTVQAIRDYLKASPHDSEFLFVSMTGAAYNENHMGRNFRRRRALAGLPDTVTFENFRDSAQTAAIEGGASSDKIKLLAGHAIGGMSDDYIRRNPRMVAEACAAIERHYFDSDGNVVLGAEHGVNVVP